MNKPIKKIYVLFPDGEVKRRTLYEGNYILDCRKKYPVKQLLRKGWQLAN